MQRRLPLRNLIPSSFYYNWQTQLLIRTQAPSIYGCRDLKDKRDNKRYLEAYLEIEENTSVITNGLTFDTLQGRITIIPCKALDDDSDIVRLSLSKLPFESERYLVPKLVASLSS
ncbi:hypothetical protein BC941DRAFT_457179 [Chlamydoabsidia padenii]|nr:hypothetical protein BC941DRAFT_457179 [Chlamydoabsidia padenii]